MAIDINIGGDNQLQISSKELREDVYQVQLSGFTRTLIVGHAKEFVEITLKSFLGISMAIGIADPLPFTEHAIPTTTITNSDTSAIYQRMLDPIVGSQAARMRFHNPIDPDDLELRTGGSASRRLRFLRRVMSSDSPRAKELRRAAALLCDAGVQMDDGLRIALAFMSIEAVLLDPKEKSDLLARLKYAVAYRLGKTSDERANLREKIKKLYDARSQVVHAGEVPFGFDSEEVIRLAREVLRKELEELPSNEGDSQ